MSVNYRGGSGYGHDFREPKAFAAGGASELNDIVGAARYTISRSDVDSRHPESLVGPTARATISRNDRIAKRRPRR
jgi:hypothetical protein